MVYYDIFSGFEITVWQLSASLFSVVLDEREWMLALRWLWIEMLNGAGRFVIRPESNRPNLELDWIIPNPSRNRSKWIWSGYMSVPKYRPIKL